MRSKVLNSILSVLVIVGFFASNLTISADELEPVKVSGGISTRAITFPEQIDVVFPDANLAEGIRVKLGKSAVTDTITQADLDTIVTFTLSGSGNTMYNNPPAATDVLSIDGLEYLQNVIDLQIPGHAFSDLSPLAGLTNLEKLILQANREIIDMSDLAGLVNLEYIDMSYTEVADVSVLENMPDLIFVRFFDTKINDVSALKNSTKLQTLFAVSFGIITQESIETLKDIPTLTSMSINYAQLYDLTPFDTSFNALTSLQLGSQQIYKGEVRVDRSEMMLPGHDSVAGILKNVDGTPIQPSNWSNPQSPVPVGSVSDGGTYNVGTNTISWSGVTLTPADDAVAYTFSETVSINGALPSVPYNGAVWVEVLRPLAVTFDSDGGSAVSGFDTYRGDLLSQPANPTKAGFTFVEWEYDDDNNASTPMVTFNFAMDTIDDDITLHAKWTAAVENINYHLDGGVNDASNPATYTSGTGVTSFAAPTKTGYSFGGWYAEPALTTPVTSISTTQTGSVDLYAKWDVNDYTLTYHLDGGTNNPSNPATYTFGVGVPSFNAPTKVGYTFAGWYLDPAFVMQVTSVSTVDTNNLDLYAKWTVGSNPITYHLDGGVNDASNPTTYTTGTGVASFAAPTKAGYKFGGWFEDATFTTPITSISTTQTGPVNVYAKWNAIKLTIKDNFKAVDDILVVYRSGDTKETSVLFPTGYSYEYDIQLEIDGTPITATELNDVTWNVAAAGECSNLLTYVEIKNGTSKLVANRTGIVTITATYKGQSAKIDVVIPGDVTRDGVLNTADALRIQNYASSKTPNKDLLGVNDKYTELMADMSGDAIINTADKVVIQKMVAKTIKPSN